MIWDPWKVWERASTTVEGKLLRRHLKAGLSLVKMGNMLLVMKGDEIKVVLPEGTGIQPIRDQADIVCEEG